jgi:hypothetical protein
MTAGEAIRQMRARCDSRTGPPIVYIRDVLICLDAIEAELKAPRFSAEEREALEAGLAMLVDNDKLARVYRKMLEAP